MKKLRKKIYFLSKRIGDRFGFDLPYFVENGFWTVSGQLINSLAGLVLSVVFARFLAKQTYGEYQFVIATINLLAIFSVTGLNASIVRSVSLGYEKSYSAAISYSLKKSIWAIPFFIIASVWYFYQQNIALAISLFFSSFFFPYLQALNKWGAYLQAKEEFSKITIYRAIQNIFLVFFLLIAAYFTPKLIVIVLIYLGVNLYFNYIWHKKVNKTIKIDKTDDDCLVYGKYLTKINAINLLFNHFDKILIGFLDIKLLAVYAITLNLISLGKNFIKSFYSISFPKFVKKKIEIKFKHILILFVIGFLGCSVLFFTAKPVIVFLYSAGYLKSADLFEKLVFVLSIVFINTLLVYKIKANQKKRKILYLNTVAPFFSIIISAVSFIASQSIEVFIVVKVFSFNIIRMIILFLPIKEKQFPHSIE